MSKSFHHLHFSMCKELQTIIDRSLCLVPKIEAARPGFRLGIEELCSLNNSIEKAKLLIKHCSESSKLYLAITGESYVTRCERFRNSIEKSLMHIHSIVPLELASQISDVIDSFRDVKFVIDSSDEEAGKVLASLLQKHIAEDLEFEAFKSAACRLHLVSSTELLVERRCVHKLLQELTDANSKKERILKHLLYLIKKYGKNIQSSISEYKENIYVASIDSTVKSDPLREGRENHMIKNVVQGDLSGDATPPGIFKCPLSSRIMYDPVIIASGQSFERTCIEKWFREGHDTCPKTREKLPNLGVIPNSSLKELISNWSQAHGIILQYPRVQSMSAPLPSLDKSGTTFSSVKTAFMMHDISWSFDSQDMPCKIPGSDAHAQIFAWSDDYKKYNSFSGFSRCSYMRFLSELCKLPSEARRKAMEDFNFVLSQDDDSYSMLLSSGFLASLITFLSDAYDSSDMIARKCGSKLLLAFLRMIRGEIPLPSENVCCLLECFTNSGKLNMDELTVIHALCSYPDCKHLLVASGVSHSVLKKLNSENYKLLGMVMEIIYQLSSLVEMVSLILSTGYFTNLVTLLRDGQFVGCCLRIMWNLCTIDEGRKAIATADHLVTSIVELLDDDSHSKEVQGVAVRMLLSLCSSSAKYCDLVMNEGVIPSLVDISVNGSRQCIEGANSLLQLLRDHETHHDSAEESIGMDDSTSKPPKENPVKHTPINVSHKENPQVDIVNTPRVKPLVGPTSGLSARKLNRQLAKKHPDPKLIGLFGGSFFSSLKP